MNFDTLNDEFYKKYLFKKRWIAIFPVIENHLFTNAYYSPHVSTRRLLILCRYS